MKRIRNASASGFSLVEVLVALVVAATLASGLLALHQHGLNQAREADIYREHMDTVQEALMGRELTRIGSLNAQDWQMGVTPPSPDRPSPWAFLSTRAAGREMNWAWPAVEP